MSQTTTCRSGPRTDRFKQMPDDELRALVLNGREAEAELRRREEWDTRYESALYAWQARSTNLDNS